MSNHDRTCSFAMKLAYPSNIVEVVITHGDGLVVQVVGVDIAGLLEP